MEGEPVLSGKERVLEKRPMKRSTFCINCKCSKVLPSVFESEGVGKRGEVVTAEESTCTRKSLSKAFCSATSANLEGEYDYEIP